MEFLHLIFFVGINTSTSVGAFTYPHGALTTFELAYGPNGWYLKHPTNVKNKTVIQLLSTKAPATYRGSTPTWNFTWFNTPPRRIKSFSSTKRTSKLINITESK